MLADVVQTLTIDILASMTTVSFLTVTSQTLQGSHSTTTCRALLHVLPTLVIVCCKSFDLFLFSPAKFVFSHRGVPRLCLCTRMCATPPSWGRCSSRILECVQEEMVGKQRKGTLNGVIPPACTSSHLSRQVSFASMGVAGGGVSGGSGGARLERGEGGGVVALACG